MAKSYEMRVKVLAIGEVEQVSDNFKKREVIGMIEGEYPDYHKFEFVQDKTELPDDLIEGTYATIHFNLRGRKVDPKPKDKDQSAKYFTSLQAWKIDAAG